MNLVHGAVERIIPVDEDTSTRGTANKRQCRQEIARVQCPYFNSIVGRPIVNIHIARCTDKNTRRSIRANLYCRCRLSVSFEPYMNSTIQTCIDVEGVVRVYKHTIRIYTNRIIDLERSSARIPHCTRAQFGLIERCACLKNSLYNRFSRMKLEEELAT